MAICGRNFDVFLQIFANFGRPGAPSTRFSCYNGTRRETSATRRAVERRPSFMIQQIGGAVKNRRAELKEILYSPTARRGSASANEGGGGRIAPVLGVKENRWIR